MTITKNLLLNWYSSMKKKFRKIRMIFDIENWLWKSDLGTFWRPLWTSVKVKSKNYFSSTDFFAKIKPLLIHVRKTPPLRSTNCLLLKLWITNVRPRGKVRQVWRPGRTPLWQNEGQLQIPTQECLFFYSLRWCGVQDRQCLGAWVSISM